MLDRPVLEADIRRRERRDPRQRRRRRPAAAPSPDARLADRPARQEFIRRALVEVALIGLASGALGCWVVLYGVSYAAESLAHALFPGSGARGPGRRAAAGRRRPGDRVAALAIALVGRRPGIGRDTAVAVVVTACSAWAPCSRSHPTHRPGFRACSSATSSAPSDSDLILSGALAAGVASRSCCTGGSWPSAFDRTTASSIGVSPLLADISVLVLLAGAVLVAVQGLGTLLAVAALVGPAATARVFTHRVGR